MISWVFKLLKSKTFFVIFAITGIIIFGLEKNKTANNITVDNSHMLKSSLNKDRKPNSAESIFYDNKNNDTNTMNYVNAMMQTDKKYKHKYIEVVNTTMKSKISNGFEQSNDFEQSNFLDIVENDRNAYYSNTDKRIASVIERDNQKYNNNRVLDTSRNVYNNPTQNLEPEIDIESQKEDFNKVNIEDNKKVSDSGTSNIIPEYITGSVIPTVENNTSNSAVVPLYGNVLINNSNTSIFPEKSDEALHECYFDANAKMKCKKSIITCTENDELGLECKESYYSEGIWHSDPMQLTVDSNETWIREHLQMRTTFVVSKFADKYFENRYAFTSLIRPDLNMTKSAKLEQVKQYMTEKTRLDIGILKLIENNNTRTSSSLLTRGTRFGVGHEKIKGDDEDLLEDAKDFLSLFMYSDDRDVQGIVDYWTLMDANNSRGDSEDFALTAMEWFLLNGVNPEYVILTEIMPIGSDVSDIILVIETHEPSDKWILKDMDIVKSEDIYPHGYEALIINEYKYVD